MRPFRYWLPTAVEFGAGSFDKLGQVCQGLGERPFIATGKSSSRINGALDRALDLLPGATVWDGVEENPSSTLCDAAAEACREAQCDMVVAIGGGSAIDVGKAVALLATNSGPCSEAFKGDSMVHAPLPIVAVPTTAGAGSETTPYSVLLDKDTATKRTISTPDLFPRVALLDPVLTYTLPRHITINTGLDALSQAMEGFVSRNSTPYGDSLALETCRIVRRWLTEVVENGQSDPGRGQMLYGAMLSGCVIAQSGTTLVHGMGYQYTLRYGVAHGLANALLLIPLFRYNAAFAPEKVAVLAQALGYPSEPEPEEAADRVTEALLALFAALELSPAAKDAGVSEDGLEACAETVFKERRRFRNQPGDPTLDEVKGFYRESYLGSFS